MSDNQEKITRVKDALLKRALLPLKVMPLWVDAIGAGAFISSVIGKNPLLRERLAEIDDKIFFFEATDIRKGFFLHIKAMDIKIVPHMARKPDVTMKGEVKLLIDVFLGKIDADTVFFSRKLEVSGDTAVAIHLKNILAGLG